MNPVLHTVQSVGSAGVANQLQTRQAIIEP